MNEEVVEMCEVETSSVKPTNSQHPCDICNKVFSHQKDLRKHKLGKYEMFYCKCFVGYYRIYYLLYIWQCLGSG